MNREALLMLLAKVSGKPSNPGSFDFDTALERTGDTELFHELVELLVDEAPQQLASIRQAIEANEENLLERAAHRLKGSLGAFCATAAIEVAQKLETMGSEGTFSAALDEFGRLESEVQNLLAALKTLSQDENAMMPALQTDFPPQADGVGTT
jgi:HPt (histidine-containing phosphotransfer) domain-containing protein